MGGLRSPQAKRFLFASTRGARTALSASMDDNCVCISEWLNKMTQLLQSLQGSQSCTSEQCFQDGELGGQQGVDLPPEQLLMLVPLVLMFVTFLVMSGRHFSQRRQQQQQALGDQKVSGGPPHPDPPQPSVD